jgi:hypothetical protein
LAAGAALDLEPLALFVSVVTSVRSFRFEGTRLGRVVVAFSATSLRALFGDGCSFALVVAIRNLRFLGGIVGTMRTVAPCSCLLMDAQRVILRKIQNDKSRKRKQSPSEVVPDLNQMGKLFYQEWS